MIRLALRTLRHRAGAFAAAFVTLVLGAAIVMACGGLMETGIRMSLPPEHLVDADVVVAGDQHYEVPYMGYTAILPERVRVDAGLVDTVGDVPGVQEVRPHVFDEPAPTGTVDAIEVIAAPGTTVDQLRERIEGTLPATAVTYVGDARGLAERPQAMLSGDVLITLAAVFGAMAIMVALFGAASMLALSVRQRHRELALIRAVGATPRQLRRLVLGETLLLAALACLIAVVVGRWLGVLVLHGLGAAGMVAEGITFHLGWIPALVAIGCTVVAALGGALVAGRRAGAIRPTQALAEAGAPGPTRPGIGRILLGLVVLGGGVSLVGVTMTVLSGELASSTGMPAVIVLAIGLATLSPLLVRPLVALADWPVRALTGQAGRMAMLNARAARQRTAAVVAPIVVLTGVATGMVSMQSIEDDAVREVFTDSMHPDAIVTSTNGVADLADEIGALPGVAGASEFAVSSGYLEQPHDGSYRWDVWLLQGVTPEAIGAIVPITVTDGDVDDLHGPAVALNTRQAAELGVRVGDPMTLRMGDNTALEVDVVALFAAADDHDTLVLPAEVLAAHTTAGRVTTILVAGDGSVDEQELITSVRALTDGRDGVAVSDRDALLASFEEGQQLQGLATSTIVAMIVAYTAISVINSLASSTLARRREFGLQRLTGFTRGQVLRMLATEGFVVALIGAVLGTLAAAVSVAAFGIGRTGSIHPVGSPGTLAVVMGGALLLTWLATLVPGWWATRQRPVEAADT